MEIDRTTLEELLRSNKFLLLIDGLNELPSEVARQDVLRFRREFSRVAIVFTTRDLSLGGDFGIEKKLEMQPLTETQMKAFVVAYVPEQSEAMLRQLGERLREFGSTPLLLWMLCGLFRQTGEIPANLGGVFRAFTTGYERNLKADVVLEGDRRWWSALLQELAARMMIGDGSVEFRVAIDRSEVEAVFTGFLRDREAQAAGAARKELDDLLRHHLIQTNGAQVEFRHQLIQEYYAAEWLLVGVKGLDDATLQQEFLNYLKWTEPVALMLALVEDEVLTVRVVELALDVDLMLGARLAGEVRSGFQERTVRLVQSSQLPNKINLPEWMKVDLLGFTKSDCAAKLLNEIICSSEEDSNLSNRAMWELRNMAPKTSIPLLKNAFKKAEKFARFQVIRALIIVSFSDAIVLALSDVNPELRKFAIHEIGETRTEESTIAIIGLISISKKNITTLKPKEVKYIEGTNLTDLSVEDTAYEIEKEIISWGGHFIKEMPRDILVRALLICIDRPDNNDVKIIATGIFKQLISSLMKIQEEVNCESHLFYPLEVQKDDSQEEISMAEEDFWRSKLTDSNPIIRGNAIVELSYLVKEIPISLVMEMLDDPNIEVSSCMAQAITQIVMRFPEQKEYMSIAIKRIIDLFQNSTQFKRIFFVEALGVLGAINDEVICKALTHEFKGSNGIDCTYEIAAITCLQCSEALPEMVKRFDSSDVLIQATIAENLPKFKDAGYILPDLWRLLSGNGGMSIFRAIQPIQANCKFYNYEIKQKTIEFKKADRTSLEGGGVDPFAKIENKLEAIDRRTQQMAEQPSTISISGGTFNGPVNLASNHGHQPTTIIDTQNNYFGADEALLQQITDLQTFITEIESQHPNLQTEDQANTVVQTKLDQLQTQNPDRWQKLRQQIQILKAQFFNPDRHTQALKATVVEVTKAKWEESLIVKAIVTYLDKFSETPNKGA